MPKQNVQNHDAKITIIPFPSRLASIRRAEDLLNKTAVDLALAKTASRAHARARTGYPSTGFPSSSSSNKETDNHNYITTGLSQNAMQHKYEQVFAFVFDRTPSEWEQKDIAFYIRKGIQEDVITAAILATAAAPRPTWRYTVAILRNLVNERCYSLEDWYKREERFAAKKHEEQKYKGLCQSQRYTQREYAPGELDRLFEKL